MERRYVTGLAPKLKSLALFIRRAIAASGAIAGPVVWVLGCVAAATRLVPTNAFGTTAMQVGDRSLLFLFLVLLPVYRQIYRSIVSPTLCTSFIRGTVLAGLLAVVTVGVLARTVESLSFAFVFGILFPAFAEELMFRAVLPGHLSLALVRRRWSRDSALRAAILISQCVFVMAHIVPSRWPFVAHDMHEIGRLFVAGVLFANLVSVRGLWLATGVHAALNGALQLPATLMPPRTSDVVVVVIGVVAVYGLFRERPSLPRLGGA